MLRSRVFRCAAASAAPGGKTTRTEGEEPNFIPRAAHHGRTETKQAASLKGFKWAVVRTANLAAFLGFLALGAGPAYIYFEHGQNFFERLDEQNSSRRKNFWARRNDSVSYQTQKRTELYKFLGMGTLTVTDKDDDDF
jgi:hypothetical protein